MNAIQNHCVSDATAVLPALSERTFVSGFRPGSGLRGLIAAAASLVLALILAQGIPEAALPNVVAAWLAGGGVVLLAAALTIQGLRAATTLAVIGACIPMLALAGLDHQGSLLAATVAHVPAALLAARATGHGTLFHGWAWFHAQLGIVLLII